MSAHHDHLIRWALAYAERGWPVLPLHHPTRFGPKKGPVRAECSCRRADCESQGKHPRSAEGLLDATVDPGTIRRWWRWWPAANIGLRTGVAFDVLDLDDGALVGLDELDRIAVDNGPAPGPMVLTGNGLHWLTAPTGAGNRAKFLPGCDWRGDGGYIVAAPSVHHTGHIYTWDPTHGLDTTLPTVPGWLLERVRRPKAQRATRRAPAGPGTPYGRKALDSELGRLAVTEDGHRNDELVAAAFRLGQLVGGSELDTTEVASSLLTVALRMGLPEHEAVATIRSGMSAGMLKPRKATGVQS